MKNIITKIILLLSVSILFADDLIVDKNSLNQYEQDNYTYFNAFNFHGEYQGNNANNPPLPNSISDRINLPVTIPVLGNQFTIEAMVYSKAHPRLPHRTIIGNDAHPASNDQNRPPTITFHSDHQINYGFGTGNEGFRIRVNNVRVDNEWIHVAFSFDGTTCKLFVNGELANSTDQAAGLIPNPVPISIIEVKTPSYSISPSVGPVILLKTLSKVLFPAPFFPTIPTISPSYTSNETASKEVMVCAPFLKRFVRFFTDNAMFFGVDILQFFLFSVVHLHIE